MINDNEYVKFCFVTLNYCVMFTLLEALHHQYVAPVTVQLRHCVKAQQPIDKKQKKIYYNHHSRDIIQSTTVMPVNLV